MLFNKLITRNSKKNLKLYWWRYEDSTHGNFGDEITRLIVEKNFSKKVEWTPPSEADLVATGSILDILIKERGDSHPYVWGSGFIEQAKTTISYIDCKIVAVRGKSTLARVTDIPKRARITLGDPGLLADSLLVNRPTSKLYKLGVIPHYVDVDSVHLAHLKNREDVLVIDPTADCLSVIKQIDSCEAIISSSLHGLIVSDSIGTPNLHLQLSDDLKGGLYKFKDYYSVFTVDRHHQIPPQTLMLTTDEIIDYINLHYIKPANIDTIKKSLKQSFPC